MKPTTISLALAVSLVTVASSSVAAQPTNQASSASSMPSAQAWQIGPVIRGRNYSVGMPAHPDQGPDGSLVMDFPVAGTGQVDALTTTVRPLAGARQITMRYRVDAAPRTRFIADETPTETATVSLYFQRAGDSWSAKGPYASYRWYAPGAAVLPITPGEHTVTIQFDETWTNVRGHPNHQLPEAFAAALRNTAKIGIAFGSRERRSHGVYATGPARFTLLNLEIR